MKILDADHPFFARVWVRWATVLFPAAWACVEFWAGTPGWGLLFAAVSAYAFWILIVQGPTR